MRHARNDSEWRTIQPIRANTPRGSPRLDDKRVSHGIIWGLRIGAPRRDLADPYGPDTTRYDRLIDGARQEAASH